jgi:flagellar motor protein MotB
MRSKSLTEDSNSYLMSVSDIMAGLMFVFIITLAIFVIDFMIASNKYEGVIKMLDENNIMRSQMLSDIQKELKELDVDVDIDREHGVLRLDENAIRFDSGSAELNPEQLQRLQKVANILGVILPCYGNNPPKVGHCLPETKGKLDSVFIEGHSDNIPIGGKLALLYKDNWTLSAIRAIYTYREIISAQTTLSTLVNGNDNPIISVSGYGEGRPVPGHKHLTPTNDPVNRRIDIRFIMSPPSKTDIEEAINGN